MKAKNIFLAITILFAFIAHSQKSNEIKEVVYTGTLKEMRKEEFATPIEIYTADYFKQTNVNNLYEAIYLISGLQANIDGGVDGSGDIEINGMEGIYTLITMDGNPISGGNSGLYALAGIPMSIIERIEVIKGPSSTLYGTDAMAGVVNIITKNPEKTAALAVDAKLNSYLESNVDVSVHLKEKKAQGILAATVFNQNKKWDFNKDNFTDIPIQNRFSLFNKWTFRNKYQKPSSIYARYNWENRHGGQLNWQEKDAGSNQIYGESIHTNRVEIFGNFQLPVSSYNLCLQTAYSFHQQHSFYGIQPFNNLQQDGRILLCYNKKVTASSDLSAGVQYRFSTYDDNLATTSKMVNNQIINNPRTNHFPSFFIQDMIRVNDHHEIVTGIRYEYNTLYKGNTFSPRFDYKWMSTLRKDFIRFSLSSGFRTPNVFADDRIAYTNGRKVILASDTKTELAYGVGLAYEKNINTPNLTLKLEIKTFANLFLNKIEANSDSIPTAVIYSNDGSKAMNAGLNLSSEWQFKFPLKINLNATVLKSYNIETGWDLNPKVLNSAMLNLTYNFSYTFKKSNLQIDWNAVVNSPQYLLIQKNDYRPDQSPWVCNMNLQFTKNWKKGFSFYAGAMNLLNQRPHYGIMRPQDPFNSQANNPVTNPFGYRFDSTYSYMSNQGIRFFMGFRYLLK